MFQNTPSITRSIAEQLHEIAATTGIALDSRATEYILLSARCLRSQTGPRMVELELAIDVRSPDSMKRAAAVMHRMAKSIEAAADKKPLGV